MRRLLIVWVVVSAGGGLAGGCSSEDAPTLTCEWLTSENCWKTTTTAALSCLPAPTATGVLGVDNASCLYPTGQSVTFDPALAFPITFDSLWKFTVFGANGTRCLSFDERENGFTLIVGNQTFTENLSGIAGLNVTCPDGSSFQNSNALALIDCPAGLNGLPGHTWSSSANGALFGLVNTSSSSTQSLQVFDCQHAP